MSVKGFLKKSAIAGTAIVALPVGGGIAGHEVANGIAKKAHDGAIETKAWDVAGDAVGAGLGLGTGLLGVGFAAGVAFEKGKSKITKIANRNTPGL